ncbi:MAG: helix-hairpin-helix domain-containing protein [Dysgonomonas sp.]|nr:helix-hairpin-helix domain-containing protein [Dysgonomonas sp.]
MREVWGVDEGLYAKITPYILVDKKVKRLKINTAGFKELNKHPYISYEQTKIIVDIRERKGKIESINRLSLLNEFTDQDLERLTPYLSFD